MVKTVKEDVSECTSMTQSLRESALRVIANASSCIDQKIEHGQELVNDIINSAEMTIAKLMDIEEEAHKCMSNTDGLKAIFNAMGCVTVVSVAW